VGVSEDWRREFPDLPHEPQELDLIRQNLLLTPAQRLANMVSFVRFVERARRGRWLGPLVAADADRK
jgi:hypothetical protein